MSRLAELQQELCAALQSATPITSDPDAATLAARVVGARGRLTPAQQLELYREQFFYRHLDAIAEDFPALVEALGWDAFEEHATAYLAACPPTSFSLRDLGARLPHFLADRVAPALLDLARLEWALVDAFDAADLPPLDATKVTGAGAALDQARLVLDPSLTRLTLSAPVHEIRGQLVDGEQVALPAPRATHLVVYRSELTLLWREVPRLALAALDELARGRPLADALDGLATRCSPDEVAELERDIGAWFGQWVADGWIRDVVPPGA